MVTEVEEPNAGETGDWGFATNVYSGNAGSCSTTALTDFAHKVHYVQLEEFTLTDAQTITKVEVQAKGGYSTGAASAYVFLSRDGGSTYCSAGHRVDVGSWSTSTSFCGSAGWSGWLTCTHDFGDITVSEARSNDLKVRFEATGGSGSMSGAYDQIQVRITFATTAPPPEPPDPSISADGVGDLGVASSDTNGYGGGTANNVEHQISTSSSFVAHNPPTTYTYTWTKGSVADSPTQYHQFTGLANGQGPFYARARYSTTEDGFGDYNASPYNTKTTWDVPSVPANPTGITDSSSGGTTSSDSPDDGGSALTDVEHQVSTASSFAVNLSTWAKGSAPSDPQAHAFTGLVPFGGLFYIRARYENIVGWGGYNLSFNTFRLLCATPSAPTITPNAVGQLGIDWSGNNTSGAKTTGTWKVEQSSNGSSGWAEISGSPFDKTTTSANVGSLGNGTTRYYRVSLANFSSVFSVVSSNGSDTTWTVPGVPGNVGATRL